MQPTISPIKKYYYAGEYRTVIALADGIAKDEASYWSYQLFKFRALQETGKFQEANLFLKDCLTTGSEAPAKSLFLLWEIYSDTFIQAPSSINECINRLDAVTPNSNDPKIEALRLGLKARLIELGISLGLLSSLSKKEAIDIHTAASIQYATGLDYEEQLLTDWRIINLWLKGPESNKERARKLLNLLVAKAEEHNFNRLLIDAKLQIAALNFEDAMNASSVDFTTVNEEYGQIEELCLQLGSEKYAAGVYYALGSLLLDYGIESGISILQQAIETYKAIGDFTQQQQAWRDVSRWYMRRGDEAETIKAEAEVNNLNKEVTMQLSTDIEAMYTVFVAQKQGDASYIYDIIEHNTHSQSQWTKLHFKTLQANTLITSGRKDEGLAQFKEIVADYKAIGVSPFHSEALFNLSNALISDQPAEAIHYLKEAIHIDEVLEDNYALAQRYLQLASHVFFSRKPLFLIDAEIDGYFSKSFEFASRSQKVDYRVQRGNLYQMQGQLYGIVNDYAKTGEFLGKAEHEFASLGIKPQLAFTLSQQGLFLINIARQYKNLESFDDALAKFAEAANLFRSFSLYTSLWRTIFHQALCHYEYAQYLSPGSPAFLERLGQAEHAFKEAALLVDELRFVADNRTGVTKQVAVSSFGKDKQELYLQAFYANFWLKKDYGNALRWLERMKSQSFLAEISAQHITIKRTKTYEDYKALMLEAEKQTDEVSRQEIQHKMEALLASLFSYSTIEKKEGYAEPIADYTRMRQLLLAEEKKLGNKRLLVVQYFCTPTLVVAFGIRSDWEQPQVERLPVDYNSLRVIGQSLFHKPNGVRAMAEEQTKRFLEHFEQNNVSETEFETRWQQLATLIGPITHWADPDDLVCLIPHGILHDLPLHTLKIDSHQYFIERNPIFYSPSLSILAISLGKPIAPTLSQAVVFGNPTNDLPFAGKEALFVAQQLKGQLFMGIEATKETWIAHYPHSSILHVAGHGKAQATNGLEQYLILANKEWLTAREIFDLKTSADLIVLSGCETGINEFQTGDELFGMIRSLLHTGANSILVSLWAVKDDSTADLFIRFYKNYSLQTKAIALQNAMKQMITEGYGLYHWGAFVLVGKP